MANAWFRLYSEFAVDAKMQMMSEADQRRFVMLLCLRCSNGDVTLHDEEVAFQLRISNEEWSRTKALFISKSMLTEDNKPTAWNKRQFVSDSSASRVYKHRQKKKQECNVTVTSPDTDTDTEIKHIRAVESAPAGFVQFWTTWPSTERRVAKQKCLDKWKSKKLELLADQIIAHVVAMKGTKQWESGYEPSPLTYLNQERWKDGVVEKKSSSPFEGAL